MKIAIISDGHSNIQALDTALEWIDDQGIEEIICLGDVVGYGADP
ncbi:MAG: metallophosphoesterase family protein, partial [Myxococcota bacterium]|nr:metallophosphoesterase family protein [Myxococcota bacterium]